MKKKVEFFDCLKKFLFLDNWKNMKAIWRKRNNLKIVKIYINWKNKWYLKLDKLSRNLHIETEDKKEVNLYTDY